MKRVGIDARLYNKTGVGVYVKNILHNLLMDKDSFSKDIKIVVYVCTDSYCEVKKIYGDVFEVNLTKDKWHSFGEQLFFLIQLLLDKIDLMHFTYMSYPIMYFKPFIATVHDITPLFFKTGKATTKNMFLYNFKHLILEYIILPMQLFFAKKIITPTETVKKDILSRYKNIKSGKIIKIYEGVSFEMIDLNNNIKKDFDSNLKPFFLYVGNVYPHKNIYNLINAFLLFKKEKYNYKFILCCPDDVFTKRLEDYLKEKEASDIYLKKQCSFTEIVSYYKNAYALVHPSLAEGFGLPIVESMYFNLKIVASDISVFKEILKDNYISFDPKDIISIKNGLINSTNESYKYDYSILLKDYSFSKMTKEILSLYKDCIYTGSVL